MKKNVEWLKEEITEILLTSKKDGTNYFYYRDLKEKIYNAIDQLHEPEVLSEEESINIVLDDLKEYIKEQRSLSQNVGLAHTSAGNDTHYRQYDYVLECVNEYEPSDDLQNLLVPKQELPVIPKFVAEHIENRRGESLAQAYNIPTLTKVGKWLLDKKNCETFARAWLDGFTVEEQKYVVPIARNLYLVKSESGDLGIGNKPSEMRYEFTEQEIKDYDERYWPFAVKVEELEE